MASWYIGKGKDVGQYTDRELKNLIHTMGKRLNQRLTELEKRGLESSSQAYSQAKTWAFDTREGMRDLPYLRDENGNVILEHGKPKRDTAFIKPRFRTDVTGRTRKELEEQVERMRSFEAMKTSTYSGIKEGWEQRYKKSQQRGYKGTFQQYIEQSTINAWTTIAKIYGSETADYCVTTFGDKACVEYIKEHPDEFRYVDNTNDGMGHILEQKMHEWYEENWEETDDTIDTTNSILNDF